MKSTPWNKNCCVSKKETSEVLQHVSFDRQSKPKDLTKPIYSIQHFPKPIRKNSNYENLP